MISSLKMPGRGGRDVDPLTIQGYYDGTNIRLLEDIAARPNQKVIITVIDEFVGPADQTRRKSLRGVLSGYADPALAEKEEGAWGRAAVEKHGDLSS